VRHLAAGGYGYVLYELDETNIAAAPERLREMLWRGFDMVVAAGGDGTISLVANLVAGSDTALAIVPVGTANTLANELGIPLDPEQACALLAGEHALRSIDGMRVGDRICVLQIEVGIGSLMIRDTPQQAKSRFGQLAYLWVACGALIGNQPERFMLTVDGERHRVSAADVLLANGGTLGMAPFRWGPGILPDDGVIDLCVVSGRTLKDYLGIFWHTLTGQQRSNRKLTYFQARDTITVNAKHRLPIQADGEIIGQTPLQVRVVPEALRVVVPSATLAKRQEPGGAAAAGPAEDGAPPVSPEATAAAAPVEALLKQKLRQITSPAQAGRVADELLGVPAQLGEQELRDRARESAGAAQEVRQAGGGAAGALIETAVQVATSDGERREALEQAAQRATNPEQSADGAPELAAPLGLLRRELLRRMRPWRALDTRLFLALNHLPHTPLSNRLMYELTTVMNGGWGWILGLLAAACLQGERGGRVLRDVAPPLWLATMAVEYPIKRLFKRQRPFVDIVRAIAVGRRPGNYSFPSGHSAAAFGGAWLIARHYPQLAPLWYSIAGAVGFSRIYLGAHYPSDVLSGAAVGIVLAELIRRLIAAAPTAFSRRRGWAAG
jgi:YegS/Rv2252/BmrU family lipid kinase